MRQPNQKNLALALNEILKRAEAGVPMHYTALCRQYRLGSSTIARLRYALLEHEYSIPKSDKPLTKMRVCRDKTWKFRFKSSTGAKIWHFVEDDMPMILDAMRECPTEQATPWYKGPKKIVAQEDSPVAPDGYLYACTGELVEVNRAKTLADYSTEELAAELMNRGWIVTFGVV